MQEGKAVRGAPYAIAGLHQPKGQGEDVGGHGARQAAQGGHQQVSWLEEAGGAGWRGGLWETGRWTDAL